MKSKDSFQTFWQKSMLYLKRGSPTILTCIGAVGVVATSAMAIQATPKALKLIHKDSRLRHDGDPYAYTKMEAIESAWKCYIPTVLIGTSTIVCIFGANILSTRQQGAITSAYSMLNESYKQYRKAANKVYGNDADSKIKAEMAKDAYIGTCDWGYQTYNMEMDSESEPVLCYDLISARYFNTTMAAVINAQYHINRNLQLRGYTSLNEYYSFLGIEGIDYGDEMGWCLDEIYEGGEMWLDFDNRKTLLEDGLECIVISVSEPNRFGKDLLDEIKS